VYDFFRGTVAEKSPAHVVLDVNGVGYRLEIPTSTYERVREAGGSPVKLLAYLQVRDDALKLFGFSTEGERRLFEHLLTIKGVGPTIALNILSGSSIPDIVKAIKHGDARFLDRIRGVGKKIAERVVLELREKADVLLSALAAAPLSGRPAAPASGAADDASRALVSLGFTPAVARKAVDAAVLALNGTSEPAVETLVKEALRHTS
jgi:holliday junction DNA helicase RuvA